MASNEDYLMSKEYSGSKYLISVLPFTLLYVFTKAKRGKQGTTTCIKRTDLEKA